ncbi:hypothetical protein EI94DRAFT_1815433 [Lactarius quietus]|nr:hypothetical protein EI94DRAFT_1815433 [Lactarius quietus]
MVVFALVNSQKVDGFFIASSRDAMEWQGIFHDLSQDSTPTGSFAPTHGTARTPISINLARVLSNVELFAQLAAKGGLDLQQYKIQCFTFVPDSTGYVAVLHNGDRSLAQCAWHNVPPGLDQLLEGVAENGVRHVTAGVNGSYVVILNTGVIWWHGVHPSLNQLLEEAEQSGRGVKTVSLSLVVADWFFIEFADGLTKFVLPPQWHGTINKHTSVHGPSMVTSTNPTPSVSRSTPSLHCSQFGLHSSFSPLNSPHPPNPYAPPPPYVGMEQFAQPQSVPQQQSVPQVPLPLQQQPAVHITNVYNNFQQPQKKSGTVSLLGGALKVAGALIPLLASGGTSC